MEKKSNSFIFKLVVSLIFSKEKAEKLDETSKLKLRHKIKIFLLFLLLFLIYFLYNTFEEPIQKNIRHLFSTTNSIEFNSKDEKTLKVLVIPFKKYNNSELNIESIADRLKEKIEKENLNLEVIYDTLAKPTTLFTVAEKIALNKKIKPDLILFGEIVNNNELKINLLNLTKHKIESNFYTEYFKKKIEGKYINSSNKKLKKLNGIKDQEYIIYKILFLEALKNGELNKARKIISSESMISLVNAANSQQTRDDLSDMVKLIAFAYYERGNIDTTLEVLNWNIKNFPSDVESREFKIMSLFRLLFSSIEYENGSLDNHLIQKIKKEVNILKLMDTNYRNVAFLYSSLINFIDNDFKKGVVELEKASSIENKDSLFPVSTIFINILKGNFKENIEFINTTITENDIDSQISKNVFLAIHNMLSGNIENTIINIKYLSENKSKNTINDLRLTKIIKLRDSTLKSNFDLDSIYNSLHNNFSDDAKINVNNALSLTLLSKNQNDLIIVKKHLEKAIKNNPDYAKYFNFNNLPKDSVIILKNHISNNKDSILNNPNNYKALSFLSNDYKKLGYDFVSRYYSQKAFDIDLNSLLYIDKHKLSKIKKDSLRQIYVKYNEILKKTSNKSKKAIAYQQIAMVLRKFEIFDYSRKYYKLSIHYDPEYAFSYSGIGWLEINDKNYNKALSYFKKEYIIAPQSFDSNYDISCAYLHLKKYDSAYIYLKKSFKKYNPEIKYISLNKLKKLSEFIENKLKKQKKTTPNKVYKSLGNK